MLNIKLIKNKVNYKLVTNLNGEILESVFDKSFIYPQNKLGFVLNRAQVDSFGTHFTIVNILIQMSNLNYFNIEQYMIDYIKDDFPTAVVEFSSFE